MHNNHDTPHTGQAVTKPCVGTCNHRWRRAEHHTVTTGEPHELRPRAGEPTWCTPCTTHVLSALRDMPELAARLQLEIEHGTDNGTEHVSGSRERPLHNRQVPARLIEEIAHTLRDWQDDICDHRNLTGPRMRLAQGPAISEAARFIERHFDWLMQHHQREAAEAFGTEILALFRRAQRVTKTDEPRPVTCNGVPCPRCDMMALERELHTDGSETGYVRCRYCPNLLSHDEYERWTKLLAAPHRKKVAA